MVETAAPAFAAWSPSPSPSTTSFGLGLAADRRAAERNETITYTIWLNVTGGGHLQLVSVNLTVDPDLALAGAAITIPFSCGTITSNVTFAEWQCSFLKSGRSYVWSVPAVVDANATRGRTVTAVAQAIELGGGPATPRTAQSRVWILLGVLELQLVASDLLWHPPAPPVLGSRIQFTVNVTNIIPTTVDPSDARNLTAYNVSIAIGISPFLDVGNGSWRSFPRTNLTPSGILIQHLSRGPGLRKDDDLVASMFLAIQEFVRDSFHTKATLDELSFAGRKAAVLRGRHLVLAALVSRGSPRYLFPQLKAAERALEKAHGPALVDWDGRVASLDQAGPVLESFLAGGFRRMSGRWR